MPAITIDRRDLLHPADERDVWVNLVGRFCQIRGVSAEDFITDLVCATRSAGTSGEGMGTITCVLDVVPALEVRRLAHVILVEHGATAEVEWTYEVAPQPVERLGVADPRVLSRSERVVAVTSRLLRRRR